MQTRKKTRHYPVAMAIFTITSHVALGSYRAEQIIRTYWGDHFSNKNGVAFPP